MQEEVKGAALGSINMFLKSHIVVGLLDTPPKSFLFDDAATVARHVTRTGDMLAPLYSALASRKFCLIVFSTATLDGSKGRC